MKKKFCLVLAILLVVTLSLTACGGSDYEGTWKAVKIVTATGEEIDYEGIQAQNTGDMIVEIKGAGECSVSFGDDTQAGKWEENKNGILVDGVLEFTLEDDVLCAHLGGDTIYFERQ